MVNIKITAKMPQLNKAKTVKMELILEINYRNKILEHAKNKTGKIILKLKCKIQNYNMRL